MRLLMEERERDHTCARHGYLQWPRAYFVPTSLR